MAMARVAAFTLLLVAGAAATSSTAAKPHIVFLLQE